MGHPLSFIFLSSDSSLYFFLPSFLSSSFPSSLPPSLPLYLSPFLLSVEFTVYERVLRRDRSGYDDIAINEFCLLESEVSRRPPKGGGGGGGDGGSGISWRMSSAAAYTGPSRSFVGVAGGEEPIETGRGGDDELGVGIGSSSSSDCNFLNVYIPEQREVGTTVLAINKDSTIVDLLFMLAQRHRLKMHTDSYVFHLTSEDQKRLLWMSPEIDKDTKLLSLGIKDILFQVTHFCQKYI